MFAPNDVDGGTETGALLSLCAFIVAALVVGWLVYAALTRWYQDSAKTRWMKLPLLCVSFVGCSWGMNVLNKELVQTFKAPTLVTSAQMLMTVVGTLVLGRDKIKGEPQQLAKWLIVPLLFFGMLASSFFTYEYLTLSMLMVIRNLGPMVTIPIEKLVMPPDKQPNVSFKLVLSLGVILCGACFYAGPMQPSMIGLAFAGLNMMLAIADRVLQRRLLTTECKGLSTETCVLMNNLVGAMPALGVATLLGEVSQANWTLWFRSEATLLLILSGIIGSGICYFAIAVQREITATSFMVLQNTARFFVVVVGVTMFKDALSSSQTIGLGLSFAGALWYGQIQVADAAAAKAKEAGAMKTDPELALLLPKDK